MGMIIDDCRLLTHYLLPVNGREALVWSGSLKGKRVGLNIAYLCLLCRAWWIFKKADF